MDRLVSNYRSSLIMLRKIKSRLLGKPPAEVLIRKFFAEHNPPKIDSSKRVLQYVGIGSMYLSPIEILIYHLLRREKFEVDYLVYDESIPINEVITKERETTQGKDKFWKKSCKHGCKMLDAGKVSYQSIKINPVAEVMANKPKNLDELLNFEFEEIKFGKIVEGSLFRYYKSLTFGRNAEQVARRMLVTALTNYFCVKQQADTHDYDLVVFSHGIYITWEPVVEFCKRERIPYVCYDRAKTADHANFNINQPSPDWSFDSAWKRFANRRLSKQEEILVDKYLVERESQRGDVYSYNFSIRSDDVVAEKARLGIPLDRKCICIFTNLIWDAANTSRDIAFPNALECILDTINYFSGRTDIQVILRSHPAEKVLGTNDRYSDLVRNHFKNDLPENLTIIEPEDDVNSFTVIDIADVGIVNTSTVGLEMAVLGKKAIIISETHFRGKGFTYDVNNSDEFFQAINAALKNPKLSSARQKLARKYFYMMMFLYQKKMPIRYQAGQFNGFICKRFSDLSPNDPLVILIRSLEKGLSNDFMLWPNE